LEAELNLDPDSNPDPELITDPDPNLQIISDPAGSGCTTLVVKFNQNYFWNHLILRKLKIGSKIIL
jgi:hypothetical protein